MRQLLSTLNNLVRGKEAHYSDAKAGVKNKCFGARGKAVRMR
jgi:hypothetical protein